VIAARFSEGKLFVLFERSNSNKNPHVPLENVICEYSKGELDRAFDATWEECQNKRDKLDNLVLRCNDYEDQSTIIEDYCYIMSWYMLTHLNEGETGWVCKRYNNQYAVVPLDNCKLAEKITILDQYAWLENFRFCLLYPLATSNLTLNKI
jgi:hypothetical protein